MSQAGPDRSVLAPADNEAPLRDFPARSLYGKQDFSIYLATPVAITLQLPLPELFPFEAPINVS